MSAEKPAKTQATITLRNLAAELAESFEVPKKQAEAILSDMVVRGAIMRSVRDGWQFSHFSLLFRYHAPEGAGVSMGYFGGIEAESARSRGEPVLAAATTGAPAPTTSTLPQNG